MLDPILAEVTLDGPETGLFVWDAVITLFFGTILTNLWGRMQRSEKIQEMAGKLSPGFASKARMVATTADEVVKMLASGDTPTDRIEARAKQLSAAAQDIVASAGE